MTAVSQLLSPLRPYQLEAARAILESVRRRRGLAFSVEIARQGGKNELSARLELLLLLENATRPVAGVKVAPTLKPQALISRDRLWDLIRQLGLERVCRLEGGNTVRLGSARQVFLSAEPTSNIVGHTAGLLLEVDEAQDVEIDKFDKELRPMAASTGATTVLYGTAWDDDSLLERARLAHLRAEQQDGVRRHFQYDWRVVANYNSVYRRYVEQECQRLGDDHPMFRTQYRLEPLPGNGRLLNPTQLALLRGGHSGLDAPLPGETYVAGLDIGGGGSGDHDLTVLTIGRVIPGDGSQESAIEVVRHYAWQGAAHDELYGALASLLKETWRVAKVAVDATGLGEALAAFLAKSLGASRVHACKLTTLSKSSLGFGLLAAISRGRVRLYHQPSSVALQECLRQLELCRAEYRPNQTVNFFVEPRDGHDDYVISLALLASVLETASPRRAVGRVREHAAAQRQPEERQW